MASREINHFIHQNRNAVTAFSLHQKFPQECESVAIAKQTLKEVTEELDKGAAKHAAATVTEALVTVARLEQAPNAVARATLPVIAAGNSTTVAVMEPEQGPDDDGPQEIAATEAVTQTEQTVPEWTAPAHTEIDPFDPDYDRVVEESPEIIKPEARPVLEPEKFAKPESEIQNEIGALERGNQELKNSLKAEISLPEVPAAPAAERQKALQTINKILTDAINKQNASETFHPVYLMTWDEVHQEEEKQHPVFPLPSKPGPEWNDEILHGPAGDVIRKASRFCEAHPAGMLVDFLVSIGNMIGRGPYFNVGETKHYTNEYVCRVGDSSTSRKGTGRDAIDSILKVVDDSWFLNRVSKGFGSGQAVIQQIHDPSIQMRKDPRGSGWTEVKVPGVNDKRLFIREGELATVFNLANRPESQASVVLRDGWDGKPLHNIVKGKDQSGLSNTLRCEEPHISISGDITIHDLKMTMPDGAAENGFGNRFLYVWVYRTQICPNGGPPLDWSNEIVLFQQIVKDARQVKHVSMTDTARKWWNRHYGEIEDEERRGRLGLAGKMTARAAAHIRRLAMIYALIDQTDQINMDHFEAAKKLWDYCEESALYIFSGVTAEQLKIINWIGQRGPQTYQQIRDELYQRHRFTEDIKADLETLVRVGKLVLKDKMYFKIG
jgi:hypothetical protein